MIEALPQRVAPTAAVGEIVKRLGSVVTEWGRMVREEGFELFRALRARDLLGALRVLVIEALPQRAVPTAAVGGIAKQLGSVWTDGG